MQLAFVLMKAHIILLSLAALGCFAGETNSITIKVRERDRDKDGKTDLRYETTYRDGKRVMFTQSQRNSNDVFVVTARSFWAAGEMVMSEVDEDGDGLFETMVIYHRGSKDMEVFTRQSDGSTKPASAEVLRRYKKMDEAFGEFWDKALDKDADPAKLENMIHETQKKIRDAGNEKTDEKM